MGILSIAKIDTNKNKFLKGISFSWIKIIIGLFVGFFQTPLFFNNIPKYELNYWYLFFSFGTFLSMADLGLTSSISRSIAFFNNSKSTSTLDKTYFLFKKYNYKQIYYTSLFFLFIILSVLSIITIITFYILKCDQVSITFLLSFIVFCIGIIFNLLANIPNSFLYGFGDVGLDNALKCIIQLLYFVALVIGISHFKSIIFISILFCLQNLIQYFALHILFFIKYRKSIEVFKTFDGLIFPEIAISIYRESSPMVINSLGSWLTSQSNILLISAMIGTGIIADFSITQQLFTYGTTVVMVINQSAGPFIAKKFMENFPQKFNLLFDKILICCMALISLFVLQMVLSGDSIIGLWVGKEHFLGYPIICMLSVTTILEIQHSVAGNFTWNMGKWPFNITTILAGILGVILGYIFGKIWGLNGIISGIIISKLVTLNWFIVYKTLRYMSYPIFSYVKRNILPVLFSGFFSYFVSQHFLKATIANSFLNSYINIILLAGGSTFLFLIPLIILNRKLIYKKI